MACPSMSINKEGPFPPESSPGESNRAMVSSSGWAMKAPLWVGTKLGCWGSVCWQHYTTGVGRVQEVRFWACP